jgi:hypothetical protein
VKSIFLRILLLSASETTTRSVVLPRSSAARSLPARWPAWKGNLEASSTFSEIALRSADWTSCSESILTGLCYVEDSYELCEMRCAKPREVIATRRWKKRSTKPNLFLWKIRTGRKVRKTEALASSGADPGRQSLGSRIWGPLGFRDGNARLCGKTWRKVDGLGFGVGDVPEIRDM